MNVKVMGAAAALLLAGTVQAAPFQNGSFESPGLSSNIATVPDGGAHASDFITGWVVTGGNVDYIRDDYWSNPADGHYSLDLNGIAPGSIQQTFDTVAGRTYRVSFALAGNPGGTQLKTVEVQATGSSSAVYTFDSNGTSGSNMGWTTQTYVFTATGSQTTLSFTSTTTASANAGPALDNVTVTDVTPTSVPTLSQWALFGLAGLLGLAALRRRGLRG